MQMLQPGEDGTLQEGLFFGADSQSELQTTGMGVSPSATSSNATNEDTIKAIATLDTNLILCQEFGLQPLRFERERFEKVEETAKEVKTHGKNDEETRDLGSYHYPMPQPFLPALAAAVMVEMTFIVDVAIATAIIFVDIFQDPTLEPSLELARGPVAGPPPEITTPPTSNTSVLMDTDAVSDTGDEKAREALRGGDIDGE